MAGEDNASLPILRAVVASERNFARNCLEHGIHESFLQFFADDSIIFAPAPTNGKAFYQKYEDKGPRLVWQPIFASVSNSGELGVTTGPWELRQSATDQTAIAFGQFVSIWKKQPDNSWKVIVDVGIDNPKPTGSPPEVQLSPPGEPSNTDVSLRHRSLEQAEKSLANSLTVDAGKAVSDLASEEIRVFRDDSFPAVGNATAKIMLNSDHRKLARKISGAAISASSDLAYCYGSYSNEHGDSSAAGHFLTIWKLDRAGDWKILLDFQKDTKPK